VTALVDTAVLSLAFRRRDPALRSPAEQAVVQRLARLVDDDEAAVIGMIRQELLSGVRGPKDFQKLRTVLDGLIYIRVDAADHDLAAESFNRCRSRGVAATDVDMLICAVAERRGLPVYTTDGGFEEYARVLNIRLEPIPR
jgi:predicted nucleic acid-binding protein